MLIDPRVRRALSALVVSLALAASVLIPIGGVASAASTSTCTPGEGSTRFCFLVISGPESVVTGVPFTVQVLVTTDGTNIANSDPCGSKVAVNLDVTPAFDGGTLSGTFTANASAGIATFTLTIPAGPTSDGPYFLDASVGGVGFAPATDCGSYSYAPDSRQIMAVTVPATQPIAPCPDNTSCTQTTNATTGGFSAATLIAEEGAQFTDVGWVVPDSTNCGTGGPADPSSNSMLHFLNNAAQNPKTIVFALAAKYVTKGIGLFNICWHGPGDASGTPFDGLLPACGKNATGPCILFKKSNQFNVAFVGVLAPAFPGDPSGYMK
jgi:hypothetical protein